MSSTRLEVISDDPAVAPRLSRSLPAALDGIVAPARFQLFSDRMDGLFDELDAEQRRRKKRFWWMYGTIYFWFVFLFIILPINADDLDGPATLLVSLCLCALHISIVWTCTARPIGAKADGEVMRDIRLECDEMTNRTPFVSFQVVLMPIPTVARGAWLQMNTVDHIAVSISASASASGAATAMSAVMADIHNAKAHESADNQEPVVYAQAVSKVTFFVCCKGILQLTGEDSVRGLHLDELDVVLVASRSVGPDEYTHAAGRTGKAGKSGGVVNVVSDVDVSKVAAWEKM